MRKRILAMFIDYLIITAICLIPLFIYITLKDITALGGINGVYTCAGFLTLFKDLPFRNASIGKKIMKVEIRNEENKIPSIFTIIFRNITVIIWPVECLLILMKKNRIGDWIFATKVVETNGKSV